MCVEQDALFGIVSGKLGGAAQWVDNLRLLLLHQITLMLGQDGGKCHSDYLAW